MKHLLWLTALLLLTFLGDRLGGAALHQLVNSSQFRYSRLYNGSAGAEVVFLGNSRGLSFFQPHVARLTGRSSFNLSYNALPADLGFTLFQDYLARNPTPSKLIIEVSMCTKRNPELIAGFGTYAPYSDSLARLIAAYDPQLTRATAVSNLYRYNNEVFQRAMYYLRRPDDTWLLQKAIAPTMLAALPARPPYPMYTEPTMLPYLVKTVGLARSRGIDVRLVVNPYLPGFADKLVHFPEFKAEITAATGLPVADYSHAVTGDAHFSDYQHLNVRGSYAYIGLLKRDAVL
jgi:hypothetical protein